MHEITRRAIDAIGHNPPENASVDRTQHLPRLPDEAGALKRVLATSAVQEIVANYQRHDAAARMHQATELRWTTFFIWSPVMLVVLGTCYVYLSAAWQAQFSIDKELLVLLILFYIAVLVGRSVFLWHLRNSTHAWAFEREQAEQARR